MRCSHSFQSEEEKRTKIHRFPIYDNCKTSSGSYSVGLGIAHVNILIGVGAAYRNRGPIEIGFLLIGITTMNRELEGLSHAGGLEAIPRKLEGAYLKLGTVDGILTFHTLKP